MTAMRTQDLDRPISGTRPATRRSGAARRPVSAAGQTRRTLERNLAAREASLRISRRASGASSTVDRPISPAPAPAPLPPVAKVATATRATPRLAPEAPRPAAAPAPHRSPRQAAAPVARVRPAAQPAPLVSPQPAPRRAAAQPLAMSRPLAIGSAAVALPAPAPALAPQPRRQLVVLPGGGEQLRERLSMPAMIVVPSSRLC